MPPRWGSPLLLDASNYKHTTPSGVDHESVSLLPYFLKVKEELWVKTRHDVAGDSFGVLLVGSMPTQLCSIK